MFTEITYQDYLKATDKLSMLPRIVSAYKASPEFKAALTAERYFNGENDVTKKVVLKLDSVHDEHGDARAVNRTVVGNRICSNFLQRFVVQENQMLLSNGLQLADADQKEKLGKGFDSLLQQIGESALLHGVCYALWNHDHAEILRAAENPLSGFVPLVDDLSSEMLLGVQFWQISDSKPLHIRVFDREGVTVYRMDGSQMVILQPHTPYVRTTMSDALGVRVTGASGYGQLPIIPLYANRYGRGELTPAMKSKIDLYDTIQSDFGDNLERTNDIYWVINNFGGTSDEIVEMLAEIQRIKATYTMATDGAGSAQATAEPHTIEVPYQARSVALELLRKTLYDDAMALDMSTLTGGSLTNVAIRTATANLELKVDRYEWQVFDFIQRLLRLLRIETESIAFKRKTIANESEIVTDIYAMRQDITRKKALELNPYIADDDIPQLLIDAAAEDTTGLPGADAINQMTR